MRVQTTALFLTGAILSVASFLAEPTRAQDNQVRPAVQTAVSIKPIGKVVSLTGSVTIEHVNAVVVQAALNAQPGQAKVGDAIYLGDTVATGAASKVAITFADDTAFDLSSNARMVMTEFVYDPNSKANSTLLSLTKGTFTFVAGKIAKSGDMKVDTPVATMGIRGTTPHVEISDDGTVRFSTLLEEGKDQVLQKYGAGGAKPGAAPAAIEDVKKPTLDICRGC
jgi:hypothetical protein